MTADSAEDLIALGTQYAEGSTCIVGDKTYTLDKVQGWVEAGSGGGMVVYVPKGHTILSQFKADISDIYDIDEIFRKVDAGERVVFMRGMADAYIPSDAGTFFYYPVESDHYYGTNRIIFTCATVSTSTPGQLQFKSGTLTPDGIIDFNPNWDNT